MQNIKIQKTDKSFDAAVLIQSGCEDEESHAAWGAIPFDPLKIDWEAPSAEEWMETARGDGITFTFAHNLLQKSKSELIDCVEAEPEAFMELVECIGSYKSRNETALEMLKAAEARLIVCLSQVAAVEEARCLS